MLKVEHAPKLEEACERKVQEAIEHSELSFGTSKEKCTEADTAEAVIAMCLEAQEKGQSIFFIHVEDTDTSCVCYFYGESEEELLQKASGWSEDDLQKHADPWGLRS